MKLVITYSDGDGYTWHCDITECVEYPSKEQFIVDFEQWANKNKGELFIYSGEGFAGTNLSPEQYFNNFQHGDLQIHELEEWFKVYAANQGEK